jgi:hypothetical protein
MLQCISNICYNGRGVKLDGTRMTESCFQVVLTSERIVGTVGN